MLLSGSVCNIFCTLVMTRICNTENSFKRRIQDCVPLILNNSILTVWDHQQVLQEKLKNLVFLIITGLKVSIKNVLGKACRMQYILKNGRWEYGSSLPKAIFIDLTDVFRHTEKNMINVSLQHKAFKLFTHKDSLFPNKCEMQPLVKPSFLFKRFVQQSYTNDNTLTITNNLTLLFCFLFLIPILEYKEYNS